MNHNRILAIAALLFIIVAITFKDAFTRKDGTYQYTGAPTEHTCSNPGCHGAGNGPSTGVPSSGGLADNAGPGNITVSSTNLTDWKYIPGVTYHMSIIVEQANTSLFGFNAVILDKDGKSTGTIEASDFIHTKIGIPANDNTYITHKSGSGATKTSSSGSFTFEWTAPDAYIGDITIYTAGIAANGDDVENSADNVYSIKQLITPSIANYTITGVLSAFEAPLGSSSVAQTITLTGYNLAKVTIMAPANFEISTTASSGYAGFKDLYPTNGMLSSILYIRMKPFSMGHLEGDFNVYTSSLSYTSIHASGTGTQPITPTIVASDFDSPFTTRVGSPSTVAGLSIAGYNLTKSFIITAPAGFQISTMPGDKFGSKLIIPLTADPFVIWVRFNPATTDSIGGNITISSSGAATVKVPISGIGSLATLIEFDGAKIKDPNLQVFPNPASNIVQFSFYALALGKADISILNASGTEVVRIDNQAISYGINSIGMDLYSLGSGTYFIVLEWQMSVYKKKFVVIK